MERLRSVIEPTAELISSIPEPISVMDLWTSPEIRERSSTALRMSSLAVVMLREPSLTLRPEDFSSSRVLRTWVLPATCSSMDEWISLVIVLMVLILLWMSEKEPPVLSVSLTI